MDSFRIDKVGYDADTDTINFYRDDTTADYMYWFEASRIKNYRQYNDWFDHLSHKMWFTPDVKYNLVDVLEKLGHNGNFDGTEDLEPYALGI